MSEFNPLKDIKEFHEKFELKYDGPPRVLDEKLEEFRFQFMIEEVEEYYDNSPHIPYEPGYRVDQQRLANQLDALVDLIYVALGTAYLQGFNNFGEAWNRVHKANMAKVRAQSADESKRNSTSDVVKPPNWVPPDLTDLV